MNSKEMLKKRPKTVFWQTVADRINKTRKKTLNASYVREVAHGCKYNAEVILALPEALKYATKKTGIRAE